MKKEKRIAQVDLLNR